MKIILSRTAPTTALIARARTVSGGRAWQKTLQATVALVTALCFALLLGTAATHHHKNPLAEHDCALCSAVTDTLAELTVPTAVVHASDQLAYFLQPSAQDHVNPARLILTPPSRGPPYASR